MDQDAGQAARPRSARDWYELVALVVVWGSAFALTKIAVTTLDPWWVTAVRIGLGGALLWIVMRLLGHALPREKTAWAWFAWLGFIGNVAPFGLVAWGSQYIPSSVAGILMAVAPLIVIVLAHWMLPDEPLTPRKGVSFGIGFVGVVLLMDPFALAGLWAEGLELAAELAMLAAAAGYALNGVTARRAPPMAGIVLATGVLIAASVQALAFAVVFAPLPRAVDNDAALATIALAVFPTALAAALVYPLLRRAGAGFVATSNYLVPGFALLVGVTLLGESLAWMDYAGLGLILAGIAVNGRGMR